MIRYQRLTLELSSDREDELTAVLWSLGPLGLEIATSGQRSLIEAYFLDAVPPAAERLLERWDAEFVRREVREVVEEDWLASYRSAAQPIKIGGV